MVKQILQNKELLTFYLKRSFVNFHPMESCRAPKGLKALLHWMHQWVFMSIFLVILTHKFLFKSLNRIWFWLGSYDVWDPALYNWARGWLSLLSRAFSKVSASSWKKSRFWSHLIQSVFFHNLPTVSLLCLVPPFTHFFWLFTYWHLNLVSIKQFLGINISTSVPNHAVWIKRQTFCSL